MWIGSTPHGYCFSRSISKGIALEPYRDQLQKYKKLSTNRDCFIELLNPRPGQNCKSTWTQAYVLAQIESVLEMEGFAIRRILPANWMRWAKKELKLEKTKTDGKTAARLLCQQRHPDLYETWRGPRATFAKDGITDAMGLMLFARSLEN